MHLTDSDKKKLVELIQAGKPLPPVWKSRLFESGDDEYVEATKVYRLVYAGKTLKQKVIGDTPSAPFQEVRSFNGDNPFPDGWRNLLIYGDNLMALKTLYDDQRGANRYGTRNKIRLIYIDPPFATRQDFMKDREKAYRDKVIGAQFIEFLRKRLILLREILADDGSIYVHLDTKKGHYIKAVLDEVFGEENFLNEVVWQRTASHNDPGRYGNIHDSILLYKKSDNYVWNDPRMQQSADYVSTFFVYAESPDRKEWIKLRPGQKAPEGWERYRLGNFASPHPRPNLTYEYKGYQPPTNGWKVSLARMVKMDADGLLHFPKTKEGRIQPKQYLKDTLGNKAVPDVWIGINPLQSKAGEKQNYPTQKPELLLERIIGASSNEQDIVLDAFAGSGTTAAVTEKSGRRWIAMDCGKLAIYTIQRRMLELTTQIGAGAADDRLPHERVLDFTAHMKSPTQGLAMISEKVKKGEMEVTDAFLKDLAEFLKKHGGRKRLEFSLLCPREKLVIRDLKAEEPGEDNKSGEQIVTVAAVRFLISFIEPKDKAEKEQPLKAKNFVLLNAGVYDNDRIKAMPWQEYKPFVMQLFGVREEPHKIHGFTADGHIGTDSAYVWNYPESKKLTIDEEYVGTLHKALGGRAGDRFFVIAPVVSMGFMMDEIRHGDTTYVFLKVPISILRRLLESDEHGAIKQPISEADVNDVMDAVGFDFVSQPVVKTECRRLKTEQPDLYSHRQKDYVIRLKEFRSHTLATDPQDFQNFETLSMILVDTDFQGDIFRLGKVYWAEDLVKAELARLKTSSTGNFTEQTALCKQLDVRIAQPDFAGKKLMAIFIDKYGNEKKEVFERRDFT